MPISICEGNETNGHIFRLFSRIGELFGTFRDCHAGSNQDYSSWVTSTHCRLEINPAGLPIASIMFCPP